MTQALRRDVAYAPYLAKQELSLALCSGGIALLLIIAGGVWFLAAPRDLTPATDSARSDAQAKPPARLLTARLSTAPTPYSHRP